jgi:hypothetical protein
VRLLGDVRILRGQRAATEQVALAVVHQVRRQPAPELVEHATVAVFLDHAGAPGFHGGVEDRIGHARQVELARRVPAGAGLGHRTRLQAVGADDLPAARLADHHVVAEGVEPVLVEAGDVGGVEALAQFEVEDLETQALDRPQIGERRGETRDVVTARERMARNECLKLRVARPEDRARVVGLDLQAGSPFPRIQRCGRTLSVSAKAVKPHGCDFR